MSNTKKAVIDFSPIDSDTTDFVLNRYAPGANRDGGTLIAREIPLFGFPEAFAVFDNPRFRSNREAGLKIFAGTERGETEKPLFETPKVFSVEEAEEFVSAFIEGAELFFTPEFVEFDFRAIDYGLSGESSLSGEASFPLRGVSYYYYLSSNTEFVGKDENGKDVSKITGFQIGRNRTDFNDSSEGVFFDFPTFEEALEGLRTKFGVINSKLGEEEKFREYIAFRNSGGRKEISSFSYKRGDEEIKGSVIFELYKDGVSELNNSLVYTVSFDSSFKNYEAPETSYFASRPEAETIFENEISEFFGSRIP